jgi:regulator of protease activity HflC (stomatin/prohibitin superfamily)
MEFYELVAFVMGVAVLALLGLVGVRSVRVVPEHHVDLVERLGKYRRTLEPGRHLLIPVVEVVRARVDLRQQALDVSDAPVWTADDALVSVNAAVHFEIVDPVVATYEIANVRQALEVLAVTVLRNCVGDLGLEQALNSRPEIDRSVTMEINERAGQLGTRVTQVEVTAISQRPMDPTDTSGASASV